MNLLEIIFIFFLFYSNESGQSRQGATNNVAEIQGATVAIQKAARLGIKRLRVNTDSELVYEAVTENIPKNRTDFEELDRVIRNNSQMTIKFKLLRGHSGNQDHNKANRLAAVGARLHY